MIIDMTHEDYMKEALKEAKTAAAMGEVPIGAIVVYRGEIISRARNMRASLHDPTAHAEMIAMREAASRIGDWRLDGCTLYVTLEPCPMCAGAIGMARVDEVVYGASDPKMGCCSADGILTDKRYGFSVKTTGSICADECALIVTEFMRKLRSGEIQRSSLYEKP